MIRIKYARGYALIVVLALMAVLVILTASISMSLESGARETRALGAEVQALNAADSGIQYALEATRQRKNAPVSDILTAPWIVLQGGSDMSVCFRVAAQACPPNLCVTSNGEAVRGQPYGAVSVDQILAARVIIATIDLTPNQEHLVAWQEGNLP